MIGARQIAFGRGGSGGRLPSEYQEVEYIESTGNQWIDTGLVWDSGDWDCEAVVAVKQFTEVENHIISQYGSGQGVVYSFVYVVNPPYSNTVELRIAYDITWDDKNIGNIHVPEAEFYGTKTTWRASYKNGSQTLVIDGFANLYRNQSWKAGKTTSAMRIIVGGMQTYGSKGEGAQFGEVKIWHNSILEIDFVPCYRKSDGKTGAFNLVNNLFYSNQGSAEFVLGADV